MITVRGGLFILAAGAMVAHPPLGLLLFAVAVFGPRSWDDRRP